MPCQFTACKLHGAPGVGLQLYDPKQGAVSPLTANSPTLEIRPHGAAVRRQPRRGRRSRRCPGAAGTASVDQLTEIVLPSRPGSPGAISFTLRPACLLQGDKLEMEKLFKQAG